MNITGSEEQWRGWFAGFGSFAPVAQNLVMSLGGIATAALVVLFVWLGIKNWAQFAKAENPEDKKRAKTNLISIMISIMGVVVSAAAVFALFAMFGELVRVKAPSSDAITSALIGIKEII